MKKARPAWRVRLRMPASGRTHQKSGKRSCWPRGARGAAHCNTTITFLGISYAEPPVGDLRWRPPSPHAHWQGVVDASHFGPHCPQLPSAVDPTASEACVFLDVYVPRAADSEISTTSRQPVIVWIYGGANANGGSGFSDPTPIVETGGVIVVTLNYRRGPLGFLAQTALDTEGHPVATLWDCGSTIGPAVGPGTYRRIWR
jgi:carboxylesterase type B